MERSQALFAPVPLNSFWAWIKHRLRIHQHEFNHWHIAPCFLTSFVFGTTKHEVQRRECIHCGWIQQKKIKEQ